MLPTPVLSSTFLRSPRPLTTLLLDLPNSCVSASPLPWSGAPGSLFHTSDVPRPRAGLLCQNGGGRAGKGRMRLEASRVRGGTCTPGDSWDGHRDRRHEAIAAAAHSLNDLLCVRPIADGFASRHDAADQGGIADDYPTPHMLKQFLFWHETVAMV